MTNKKLKPGAVQDGLLIKKYAEANGRLLFAAMVCLHRAGISRPALREAWDLYSKVTVPQWRQNGIDGIAHKKLKEELRRINVPWKSVAEAVYALLPEFGSKEELSKLIIEFSVFCLHMNRCFGYGGKRITRILNMMERLEGDPEELAKKEIGVEIEPSNGEIPDARAYLPKKDKPLSYSERKRLSAELEAVRIIQEGK